MGAEEVRLMKGDVDNFPVGMRVLAVDDDPICLKLLDGLLRKCQYHVTTTNQAKVALNMLRENRERFDLVISDVHMPDMDGFKLLEQVGLEMDLPVIMLSANSDPRLVMQGVTHGACDYLVKPVRLEELRNIWQHVVRKKKVNPDHQKKTSDEDKFHQGHAEEGRDPSLTCYSDHNGKINKKRKDDDDGADENNDPDSDDPTSQKKPRVVWSIDLHRKFVTAVNQLGIEKAVPKRILDLMNVEGLTRENVASHLQKYRLYLKRISSNAAQQANLVAALGSKDAYMRMGSLDGFGTYQTLAGSGRLANTVMSPYNSSGMLGRLNSSTGISLQNLTSSGLIQPSHAQNFNGPMSNIGQFPSIVLSGSSNGNSIQRTPTNLSIDQLNQSKHDNCFGVFNPPDDQKVLVPSSSFKGSGAIGTINNSFSPSSNSIILQENCYPLTGGDIGNHSSLTRTSFLSDGFNVSRNGSSGFMDPGRSNQTLQNTSPLMNFQSSSSHLTDSLNQGHFPLSSVRENQSSAVPSLIHPLDISATTSISTPIENSRRDVNCEENFPDSVPNFNQLHSQSWGDNKQTYSNNSDVILRTLNSQLPASHGTQNLETNPNRQINISLAGRPNGGASTLLHQDEIGRLYTDPKVRSNGDYLLGQTKQHGGFTSHGYDSFDDLMSAVKPEHDGTAIGGGFALDVYSFGSCM